MKTRFRSIHPDPSRDIPRSRISRPWRCSVIFRDQIGQGTWRTRRIHAAALDEPRGQGRRDGRYRDPQGQYGSGFNL